MRTKYKALLSQIRLLSRELLPPTSPTASYTQGEVLRMFAFRISVHAEIEAFVEFCAETLLADLAAKNKTRSLSQATQKSLLLYKDMNKQYPPASITFQVPARTDDKIRAVLNVVSSDISSNNGVSEKDIIKLFVPLGVELGFFDQQWLLSMNGLARARGEAAHNSWLSNIIVQQPAPDTERARLVTPLLGIRSLIAELERLQKAA